MSKLKKQLKPIKALLLDCDGVMTDGKIWQDSSGEWRRSFYILDGMGIKYLLKKKFYVGIISGSKSKDIRDRCSALGIKYFYLGTEEKSKALDTFIKKTKLNEMEIAYIGDDIIDIPVLKRVGLPITVPNAVKEVFNYSLYVTHNYGGLGAVREVCDLILNTQIGRKRMTQFKPLKAPVEFVFEKQKYTWGDCKNFVLFSGPDIVEDEGMVLEVAQEMKRITTELSIPWILKCSFDKANRQSGTSFRGPGVHEAFKILERIKSKVGCPLLTDVHETNQVEQTAEVAEVIQIPAFLSRQTDLVVAAAKTGRILHIKKGQFLAPWDMRAIAKKAVDAGNSKILLCERGTTFGYNRLINDMTGLVEMRNLGFPVIMDCTHSTQLPGANDGTSGGRRNMVPVLARAAVAVGVDGLFFETHPDPDNALCDGPTSMPLKEMESVLKNIKNIWNTHFQE